jgi:PAS domain S-box-containing protein
MTNKAKEKTSEQLLAEIESLRNELSGLAETTDQLKKAENMLKIQRDLAIKTSSCENPKEILNIILETALETGNFQSGGIYLFNSRTGELKMEYFYNLPDWFVEKVGSYPPDAWECGVVRQGKPLYGSFVELYPHQDIVDKLSEIKSVAIIPFYHDAEIIGCLNLASHKEYELSENVRITIEAIANHIGGIIFRMESELHILESQRNFQTLFDTVEDLLFIIDPGGKIIHFNPAVQRHLGYSPEELAGLSFYALINPEDCLETSNIAESLQKSQLESFTCSFTSANGTKIPSETLISSGRWDGRDVLFAVSRDITEREKLRKNLIIAKEEAETANLAKTTFLTHMSHEFRTPMNSIIGMTEMLLKTDLTKKQFNFVNIVTKSAENLLVLLNDILDISRIESGEIYFEETSFSLKDLVSNVINTNYYSHQAKGIDLICDFLNEPEDIILKGDHVRLSQVIQNLVENAIKYTDKGSVEANIRRISETPQSITLGFTVKDTGIGISEEVIAAILSSKPLLTDKVRGYGSGLGLTIATKLLRLQGSKISINSTPGTGSIMSFEMEFKKGSKAELLIQKDQEIIIHKELLENIRILLAEDQVFNQIVVQSMVEDWGFSIDIVETGDEVIRKLAETRYDVVLMDIQMPGLNGLDTTRYIRSKFPKPLCDIPIIAITANAYRDDHLRFLQAGMNDTVSKPFKSQILFTKIAHSLGYKTPESFPKGHPVAIHPEEPLISTEIDAEQTYDLSVVENIAKGNRKLIAKMIQVFIDKASEEIELIRDHASREEWDSVSIVAHKMKPAISYMGMKDLETRVNEIYNLSREKTSPEKLPILIEYVYKVLGKTFIRLEEDIKKYQ